jgi:hypothetical protein
MRGVSEKLTCIAEVPLTRLAVQAFQDQLRIAGPGIYLFPSDKNKSGHQATLKTVWHDLCPEGIVFLWYRRRIVCDVHEVTPNNL